MSLLGRVVGLVGELTGGQTSELGKAAVDLLAKCKDGMYWHSAGHRGACSHHGGVENWLDGTEKK